MTDVVNELTAARGVLAEQIGEDASKINIEQPAWLRMAGQGVIVSLHIGHWPALQQMSAKDLAEQLGIDASPEELAHWKEFLALGANRLLPLEYTREASTRETAIRSALDSYSYKVPWGQGFVPVTVYKIWKEKHEKAIADYFAFRDKLVSEYSALRSRVIASYEAQAGTVYDRLCKAGVMPAADKAEFVERFVARIAAKIKTSQQVYASFYVNVDLSYVPVLTSAEQAASQSADMMQWATARLDQEALAERQRQLADMNADIAAEFQRRKQTEVDAFLKAVVKQLRGHVYETTVAALESIKRNNGKLVGRAADGLRSFITTSERLNFYDDVELSAALTKLGETLGPVAADRSAEAVQGALQNLGLLCRHVLLQLGETPRSAREVGISDGTPVKAMRAVRREIGIDPNNSTLETLGIVPVGTARGKREL